MAFFIRQLPFPDVLAKTPCKVKLYGPGLNKDGGPVVAVELDALCIFSEHAKRTIDKDGKAINLTAKAIIKGDIAPSLPTISDGVFEVFGREYEIHAGHRPRNPDATVHHSELELL